MATFGANKMIISFIIIAVILWSSSFVGIRAALNEYSPIEIAVLRFVISSIALFLIILFQKINLPNKKDYFHFALLGLALFIFLLFGSYNYCISKFNWVVI